MPKGMLGANSVVRWVRLGSLCIDLVTRTNIRTHDLYEATVNGNAFFW